MKSVAFAAAVFALPALAADPAPTEGDIEAIFAWTAIRLAAQPAPDGGTTSGEQAHLVLTSKIVGSIDRLAGTCLMKGSSHGDDWTAVGACALKDADGDMLSSVWWGPAARDTRS